MDGQDLHTRFFERVQLLKHDVSSNEKQKTTSKVVVSIFLDCGVAFNEWSFISFSKFQFLNSQNVDIRINQAFAKFYEFWTNTVSVPLVNFQLISRSSRQKLRRRRVSRSTKLTVCKGWCTFLISNGYRDSKLLDQRCISDGIPWNIHCTLLGKCQSVKQQRTQRTFLQNFQRQLETSLDSRETSMMAVRRGGELSGGDDG